MKGYRTLGGWGRRREEIKKKTTPDGVGEKEEKKNGQIGQKSREGRKGDSDK